MLLELAMVSAQLVSRTEPTVAQAIPEGSTVYVTSTAGYDGMMNYRYRRQVWVILGPPEQADGYPPPPALEIRHAMPGFDIVLTPEGQRCDPAAPVFFEYGRELFRECAD